MKLKMGDFQGQRVDFNQRVILGELIDVERVSNFKWIFRVKRCEMLILWFFSGETSSRMAEQQPFGDTQFLPQLLDPITNK